LAILAGLSGISFIAAMAFGQDSQTVPAFQVADVHASAPVRDPTIQGALRAGRSEIRRATMLDLIKLAYGVDDSDLVFGGPSWLDWDRFDVIAKSPADTPSGTVKLMLRALLVDRFKLTVHTDTRAVPGFLLTVNKGQPKLRQQPS
jgi:uncharacterized protein (TIGR03435 family)